MTAATDLTVSNGSHVARGSSSPISYKHKKHSDPFEEIPDDLSSLTENANRSTNDDEESMFTKLILTPMTAVSFIFSLFVVDTQNRSWRLSQHGAGPGSWFSRWWSPEPYQEPENSTWHKPTSSDVSNSIHGAVPVPHTEHWFARKKHRKMAKLEIGDALEMQSKMTTMIVVWTLLILFLSIWTVKKFYFWLR